MNGLVIILATPAGQTLQHGKPRPITEAGLVDHSGNRAPKSKTHRVPSRGALSSGALVAGLLGLLNGCFYGCLLLDTQPTPRRFSERSPSVLAQAPSHTTVICKETLQQPFRGLPTHVASTIWPQLPVEVRVDISTKGQQSNRDTQFAWRQRGMFFIECQNTLSAPSGSGRGLWVTSGFAIATKRGRTAARGRGRETAPRAAQGAGRAMLNVLKDMMDSCERQS